MTNNFKTKAFVAVFGVALSMAGLQTASARPARCDKTCANAMVALAPGQRAASVDVERERWNESGGVGRMGLGADPRHPEGPGNPVD
jgi:hypothetical protein